MLGDVVGQSGCRALFAGLAGLVKRTRANIVIANAENAAGGYGLTSEIVDRLLGIGVDAITTGNHVWQNPEIRATLDTGIPLLRPENYPEGVPGRGHCIVQTRQGMSVGVLNLEGRVHLSDLYCPFRVGARVARRLRKHTDVIIVDFHAEWTEEKEALAWYLDGTVSVLVGTHTHVQTADERILPKGTGYITDIGMTGPTDGVIGMNRHEAVRRALTQMPLKLDLETGPASIMGVVVEISTEQGKTLALERVHEQSIVKESGEEGISS